MKIARTIPTDATFMSSLLLAALFLAEGPPPTHLERLGRFENPAIREASGMVRSRVYPGIFWVHNDSGNPPVLFAVRRDGSLVRAFSVNVPNTDWEDIAADDAGHLYIGEIGNNDGRLPLRAVYRLTEPDPFRDGEAVLKVETASYYRFPPSGRFDAEALVFKNGTALIVSKTFDGRPAAIFSVPFDPPAPLLRPALPVQTGTLAGFQEPVTGADLTANGRRLVVCSLKTVGVYELNERGDWKLLTIRSFQSGDQVEAVAWDGDDILLAGEDRGLFRIAAKDWRAHDASAADVFKHAK